MKKEEIILIGGGGHCKACIDVIELGNKYQIKGIIDVQERMGQKTLGYEIIGSDDDIPTFIEQKYLFLISIGYLGKSIIRKQIFEEIKEKDGHFATVISPLAYVSKHSKINEGSIVMHHSVINANASIGYNTIINNMALIEHDCNINNHVHVSTGAKINGQCSIGDLCFIGSGSIINQSIKIESNTIIGSGSLVRKSVLESGIYVGNPLKKYK